MPKFLFPRIHGPDHDLCIRSINFSILRFFVMSFISARVASRSTHSQRCYKHFASFQYFIGLLQLVNRIPAIFSISSNCNEVLKSGLLLLFERTCSQLVNTVTCFDSILMTSLLTTCIRPVITTLS